MVMKSINVNGCSVCQPGKENFCTYTVKYMGKRIKMYQYDYRMDSGDLFTCCAPTLEKCREKRDVWLKNKHLVSCFVCVELLFKIVFIIRYLCEKVPSRIRAVVSSLL